MASMTWNDFLQSAHDFMKLSLVYDDSWIIVEKDSNEGNTYLVYKQKIVIQSAEENLRDDLESREVEESEDSSNNMGESTEDLFEIEYHVVYSISYQVPVLYFNGFRSDGKQLSLEDAWKIFKTPLGESKTRANMLSTLTQSDHPVLFRPFLGLHPCRTAELLNQMGKSENPILTFLSIMGPFVKLNLKNEYGLFFKQKQT